MRLRATAHWNDLEIAALGLPRGQGWFVVKLDQDFVESWGKELARLRDRQVAKFRKAAEKDPSTTYADNLIDLELNLEVFYRKRSLNANALLWSLYAIEANWANGNADYRDGYLSKRLPGHVITPEDLHDDDCEVYAEKTRYKIKRADKFNFTRAMALADMGKVVKTWDLDGEPDLIAMEVWKTTSFLDTKEFSVWVNRVIDRIRYGGLLASDTTEFLMIKNQFEEILKEGSK